MLIDSESEKEACMGIWVCVLQAWRRVPEIAVPQGTYIHIHPRIPYIRAKAPPPCSTLCLGRGSSRRPQKEMARREAARPAESGGEATPIHGPAGSRTTAHTHSIHQILKKKYVARGLSRIPYRGGVQACRPCACSHTPLCLPGTCSRIPVKEATVRV